MIRSIVIFVILLFISCKANTRSEQNNDQPVIQTQHNDTLAWNRPRFIERENERLKMVRSDIQHSPYNPVKDIDVVRAMQSVPRHLFIPPKYRSQAYGNHPLPIGHGQTISQPLIVAHMTELLEIQPGHKILEIGTGSGYQAAVLSELTPYVYSIEIVEELGIQAKSLFSELGYNTIRVKIGDGYEGWPEHAPFDGIIVTCAPEEIPEPLIKQLKPGGKIVIPVGKAGRTQMLVVVEKNAKGGLKKKTQYPVVFVPMTGKAQK